MELHEIEIAKWKKNYPFLNNVWQEFLDFNQDVIIDAGDEEEDYYYALCEGYETVDSETEQKNKRFCMKLLKNVASASDPEMTDITGNERCSYVNIWLYFYTKYYHVEDSIIKKIFEIVNGVMQLTQSYTKCEYESYTNFFDPDDIIKLLIFSLNLENIKNIMKDNKHIHYDIAYEYILECANTYKRMNKKYCVFDKDRDPKHINTCAELEIFKDDYISNFFEGELIGKKLPDINIIENDAVEELQVQQEKDPPDTVESGLLGGFLSGSLQRNITTGAVAAAGTGALLLVLNKFTPAGNIFRSGKKGHPRVSNLLDEGPSEKNFLNDPDYLNVDSDTMGYNVGYSSTENY